MSLSKRVSIGEGDWCIAVHVTLYSRRLGGARLGVTNTLRVELDVTEMQRTAVQTFFS